MDTNTFFITAFGTFGNPNGFRQSYYFTKDKHIANSIKTFDLNTNAIKLFPKSKVYAIRKESVGDYNVISYIIYTYAKELNSERSGTFIGSAILFANKIAEENMVINQLNEFHESLVEKNVQNDMITVTHSDKFSIIRPTDYGKIEFHLKPVEGLNFIQFSGKNLVVFSETSTENLQQLLKKAVDLLNVYDTIYFTGSREVAEFVNQKGIFRLIQNVGDKRGFEEELQNLYEEQKQKIESSISELEMEIKSLNADKIKTIRDFREQIEKNEKLHQENGKRIWESKSDLEKVEQMYNVFSSKIYGLANDLKSGRKLEDVKYIYYENKSKFIDGVSQLKKPDSLNSLPKANARSGLQAERQYQQGDGKYQRYPGSEQRGHKINIFKVTTLLFLLLLIGTWGYLFIFNPKQEPKPTSLQQEVRIAPPDSTPEHITAVPVQELNPKPNSQLNENDYRLVARELIHGKRAEDVVKIIFQKNPADIKSYYTGQEAIYTRQIIELNKNCFEESAGVTLFAKDTLRVIPAYKKEK